MERIRHIDILRCIAIILVVIGHVGSVPGCGWIERFYPIYSYHLALFLFISGYLFKDIAKTDYKAFFLRKTKNLLLPLIGWNIVYAVIVNIFSNNIQTTYFPSTNQIWRQHMGYNDAPLVCQIHCLRHLRYTKRKSCCSGGFQERFLVYTGQC